MIIVTGGGSGIGRAITNRLRATHDNVCSYDLPNYNVLKPTKIIANAEPVDILINCAGANHLDWLEDFEEWEWDKVVGVNAKGIYMMSRFFLSELTQTKGTILNILSDAAHRPMNCSIAYNASKGAAHIMTLQMARELTKRHGITVFGIAPSHIAGTGMSRAIETEAARVRGWTPQQTKDYQRNNSVTGKDISVDTLADFVAYLLSHKSRHEALSGCVLPYGA